MFQDSRIAHVNCARGRCDRCPKLFQPGLEKESTSQVSFYSFLGIPACSKHGQFNPKNDLCPSCSEKDNNDGPPGVTKRKHLALQIKKINEFWTDFEVVAAKHKGYRRKMLMLSKKNTVDVRQSVLREGDVAICHNFTECLTITHNEEVQSKHYGQSANVSIEGCAVASRIDGKVVVDFYSCLSGDMTQKANIVYDHMEKLIQKLLESEQLKKGGRILHTTEGCAKQATMNLV